MKYVYNVYEYVYIYNYICEFKICEFFKGRGFFVSCIFNIEYGVLFGDL